MTFVWRGTSSQTRRADGPPQPPSNPIYRFLDRIFWLCERRTHIFFRQEKKKTQIESQIQSSFCTALKTNLQPKLASLTRSGDSERGEGWRAKLAAPIPLFTFRSIRSLPSAPPCKMRNQIRPLGPGDWVAGGPPLANLSSLSVKRLSDARSEEVSEMCSRFGVLFLFSRLFPYFCGMCYAGEMGLEF